MPADPDVSVVIPTRDRHASLRRTLQALAAQETAREFEVVVVDDGSSPPVGDAELAVLSTARRVDGPGRGRAAGARNAGIAAARGRLVLFTDDDTEPVPDWVETAAAFLDAHPDHVGVEGPVVSPPYDPLYAYSMEVDGPGAHVTCNLAFRADVLRELGGFDEQAFGFHCEDVDLGFRARRIGPIGYDDGMRVLHHPRWLTLRQLAGRGRMTVNEIELFQRHREHFGRAARLPARIFPLVGAAGAMRALARRSRLDSPRRIARYGAYAALYLWHVVAGIVLRPHDPAPPDRQRGERRAVKVLFVMPYAHRHGGAENILWTFLQGVDRSRIEPALVFFEDGPFRAEAAALGMATHVLRPQECPRPRLARFPPRLARIVRAERPQLVFSWMVEAAPFGALAALLAGRGRRAAWWQANMPTFTWVERLATALPTRAVFLYSHATAAAQRTIRPRRRTIVVHPGIPAPRTLPPGELARLRAETRLPDDRPVIGIVGRLQAWKGQHHVLRALALLRDRGVPAHGLIVGGDAHNLEPGYEPSLHALTRELGLEEQVTFTGQVPDGTAYIQLMDVAVNASELEPFGIVLLEAMAQGVPVVAADAGGPAEIVEDGESGLLVHPMAPEPLAGALERLAADPALRERIAAAGRRRYEERFTDARMVEELTGHLEAIEAEVGGRAMEAA